MKKSILSLLLSGIILFGNISHGSTINNYEEVQEKTLHRLNVGFSNARRLNMEMINCSPTVTFTSTVPNLKIINVANIEVPDLKAVPINSNNPNALMLVPDIKEEDNLLDKAYVSHFTYDSKKFRYSHATHPLALYIPKNEPEADYENADGKFLTDKEIQQHCFFEVEANFGDEIYTEMFSFQSSLNKYLIIKKEKNNKVSISMANEIYPEKS